MKLLVYRLRDNYKFSMLNNLSQNSKIYLIVLALVLSASSWAQNIIVAPDPENLLREDKEEKVVIKELTSEQLSAQQTRWRFNNFRNYYFARRQIELDVEMLLREKYLLGLYKAINKEIKERKGIDYLFEIASYESGANYAEPELPDTMLSIADYYLVTKEYIRAEHHHKLIYTEALKAKLVQEGTGTEIKRMFDYDLRLSYKAYNKGDFPLAILILNHMLQIYPYSNMDDILFYRAEAEYGAYYFISAASSYNRLLDQYPESPYVTDALARLFYIYEEIDKFSIIKENVWDKYGENDFGFGVIQEYDKRWEELSDSLDSDTLEKDEKKRLKQVLKAHEKGRSFTDDQVFRASKMYYAAGLGLFLGGYYDDAHEALSKVPNFTPNEYKAAYLDGQSLLHLRRYDEAIKSFKFISESKFKKKDPEYLLADDAKVKLGYCYSEIGDIETSRQSFRSLDDASESYGSALLGEAWLEYRLNHFTAVDSITDLIIEKFPDDPQYYEAISLGGYNRELIGRQGEALSSYQSMVKTLNSLTDVRGYIAERRIITRRIKEAKLLEEDIIAQNDPNLFLSYVDLTQVLDKLYKRIKLAEIVELNARMKDFLLERDSLRVLYDEWVALGDTIALDENNSLGGAYLRLEERLKKLSKSIQMGGFTEATRSTATKQSAEIRYHNEVVDTLVCRLENEYGRVISALNEMQTVRESIRESGDLNLLIELEMAEADLIGSNKSFEQNIVNLSEGRMVEISTDIETWRDFAFRRYALADMDFDYLVEQISLLDDLNEKISSISRMIDMREQIEMEQQGEMSSEETESLDEEVPSESPEE
ncbi:MAG: hypothetical protein P9L92_04960 [Candidatus Electryonea clarkiae]|nr:hypothetical protein [Candidatus Electryonea clarkiae]MDP8288093.1 hypothetical protein [Candidatus Electryonea clarkiae]